MNEIIGAIFISASIVSSYWFGYYTGKKQANDAYTKILNKYTITKK